MKEKSVQELKSMLDNNIDFILLDVRTNNEVLISKISNKSYHIPMNDIPDRINEIDKSQEVIVYCKSGQRSARVCEFLENNNFLNTYNLKGGILAWRNEIDPEILI